MLLVGRMGSGSWVAVGWIAPARAAARDWRTALQPYDPEAVRRTCPPYSSRRHGSWSDLAPWRHAAHNTWHCLLGGLLGDFAVMAILPLRWPGMPTRVLFGLAIAAGIPSSMRL